MSELQGLLESSNDLLFHLSDLLFHLLNNYISTEFSFIVSGSFFVRRWVRKGRGAKTSL